MALKQRKPTGAPKRTYSAEDERISKSRAFNAGLLTILSLVIVVVLGYHFLWAVKVMTNQPYGSFLNNLVYGPGTLVANAGLSMKFISYINNKLVEDKIDADHKKYI
ncbi:uncharacterized protein RJT20DRAFT_53173 [Scheffersomyces xylosifermentans]|uniref:uncharacterized protein n=1 Tax=Scheffersomyces xylosifermentans TaxID=1304137 RepID=UPI00315D5E2F